MQGGFDGYDTLGLSSALGHSGLVPAAADVQEDDLDMLQMMATLERTSTATGSGQARHTAAVMTNAPTSASDALVSLHAAIGAMGGTAVSRSMKAARPKLSSAAAATLSNVLSRHPALQVYSGMQERVDVWLSAVNASMSYEVDDDEDERGVESSTQVALDEAMKAVSSSVGGGSALADQSVLSASGTAGVRHAFVYCQQLCDELEFERLGAVFRGPDVAREVVAAVEKRVELRHRVDPRKGVVYPGDSAAVPQRCWFHCLFGPLLSPEHADWSPPAAASSTAHASAEDQQRKSHASQPQLSLETSPRLADVRLPLVSASLAQAVERTSRNPYDTSAWLHVLESALDIPITDARSTWQLACYLFPTSAPVVMAYLRCELAHLNDLQQSAMAVSSGGAGSSGGNDPVQSFTFQEGLDEETAKHIFRSQLRILNVFYRHLPRCVSWEMYEMLFVFIQSNIVADTKTIDQLFRYALEQHVGCCVDSTPLWLRYLEWRAPKTSNITDKQTFVRMMFLRILRTPLYGLQEVRERYDMFESAEVRGGRFRLEDELERSMTRAKSIAADRVELLRPLLRQRLVASSVRRAAAIGGDSYGDDGELPTVIPYSSTRVFLPRPFRPEAERAMKFASAGSAAAMGQGGVSASTLLQHISGGASAAAVVDDAASSLLPEEELFEEQETWQLLHRSLAAEIDSNYSPANTEEGHFRRVAFSLRLRLSMFPHEAICWLEYSNILLHGLPRNRPRADFGPTGLVGSAAPAYLGPRSAQFAAEVLEDAIMTLHPYHTHTTVVVADMCRMRLGSPRQGDRFYYMALEACRSRLLSRWLPMCDALLQAAQKSSTSSSAALAGGSSSASSVSTSYAVLATYHDRFLTLYEQMATCLETIVVLAGNWLTYSRAAYPKTAATQTRLVARYLLQDLELLSMVMGSLRRLVRLSVTLQCPDLCSPKRLLDTFNAFCSHWVTVELHQLHSPDAALAILHGWAEQYKSMISSTRQQHWGVGDCGVDERFFARACEVGSSWGKRDEGAPPGLCEVPTGTTGASNGAVPTRRWREVLTIVDDLVRTFPEAPPTTAELAPPPFSNDAVAVERCRTAHRRLAVFASTIAPRRWIMLMCQRLDPVGVLIRGAFPKLLMHCRSPISADGPPSPPTLPTNEDAGTTTHSQAAHSSWHASLRLGGVATSGASELVRSCYARLIPVHMCGVADSNNSQDTARRTHHLAETLCLEDARAYGYLPLSNTPQHKRLRGGADDDDVDAVYPDAACWQALPPRPAHVTRGGRGAGRGRGAARGGGASRGGQQHHAAHVEDDMDDDHLDTDIPSQRPTDSSGGGGASDNSALLSIGNALMSMSAAMEKRAKQTLGRRVAVQAASFHTAIAPREGLLASLDLAACDRRVEEIVEEIRHPKPSHDAAAPGDAAAVQPPTSLGRRIELLNDAAASRNRTLSRPAPPSAVGSQRRREPPKATPEQVMIEAFVGRSRAPTICGALPGGDAEEVRLGGAQHRRQGPLLALESLLCHALPSRYSFGGAFDAAAVNTKWLVNILQQTPTLQQDC